MPCREGPAQGVEDILADGLLEDDGLDVIGLGQALRNMAFVGLDDSLGFIPDFVLGYPACKLAAWNVDIGLSLGGDTQQIQAMVADSEMDLHMSRLLVLDCASRMDAGLPIKTESAMTKIMVSEAVNRVADRAAQMMGARGMSEDTAVAWILNELRPFRIYDGASELHRATLGRRLLRTSSTS